MKGWPLKRQFTVSFALILVLSAVASVLTYGLAILVYTRMEFRNVYPANYYEQQIPALERELRSRGLAVLDGGSQEKVEALIPLAGMSYQVVNRQGERLYGMKHKRVLADEEQLYAKINTTFYENGRYVRVIPVIGTDGELGGAVLLFYKLANTFTSGLNRYWVIPLFVLLLLSPFFYVLLFTLLFAKRLAGNIGAPVRQLIEAARKVKDRNLDFVIDYQGRNELGELSEAFRDMKDELQTSLIAQWRMEQERLEMVENLAHDLKTPLTIIQGYADALLEEADEGKLDESKSDEEKQREKYVTVIKDNAVRSAAFVEQMQTATEAEAEAGLGPLQLAPVDIPALFKARTEHFRLLAAPKQIRVTLAVADNRTAAAVGQSCSVDEWKLERMLDNLLSNALRYTPVGGEIGIEATIGEDQLVFRVADSGPGFTAADHKHMFEKHYRGRAGGAPSGPVYRQSGLGLYIVRQLAELHGGGIRAYRSASGGAGVEVTLHY